MVKRNKLIKVTIKTKKDLDRLEEHPRATYDDTISKLTDGLDEKILDQLTDIAKTKGIKVAKLLNEILFVFLEKEKIKKG